MILTVMKLQSIQFKVLITIVSVVTIVAIEGDEFSVASIVFECVSAISTTGLSMGITPFLSVASKVVLAVVMFVGRVGMLTIVLALSTKKDINIEQVEYNNTDIIVG